MKKLFINFCLTFFPRFGNVRLSMSMIYSHFVQEDGRMAISEDLRSVQAMLGGMETGNVGLVRLLCDNLSALADQVEALEGVPLAPVPSFSSRFAPGLGVGLNGGLSASPCGRSGVPLQ